jgi:hypothetical protein
MCLAPARMPVLLCDGVTEGVFQEEYAGGSAFGTGDGFILKLSGDGSRVLHASYFGGSGDD